MVSVSPGEAIHPAIKGPPVLYNDSKAVHRVKMRVVCTGVAALWLAVVARRATEGSPGHCCPSRF